MQNCTDRRIWRTLTPCRSSCPSFLAWGRGRRRRAPVVRARALPTLAMLVGRVRLPRPRRPHRPRVRPPRKVRRSSSRWQPRIRSHRLPQECRRPPRPPPIHLPRARRARRRSGFFEVRRGHFCTFRRSPFQAVQPWNPRPESCSPRRSKRPACGFRTRASCRIGWRWAGRSGGIWSSDSLLSSAS